MRSATVLGDAIVDETTGEKQPALIVVFAPDDTDDDSLTWPKLWALPQVQIRHNGKTRRKRQTLARVARIARKRRRDIARSV